MTDYIIIIKILLDVLNGKNLTNSFAEHINQTYDKINIAKIKDISYGVIRNYNILNCIVTKLVAKKPNIKIEIIILIGIYELKFSKKPEFAVTNEIVNLSYKVSGRANLKSFVNGVLRNYIRNINTIEIELGKIEEYNFNFPYWLIGKLKHDYPKEYKAIIENLNLKPKLGIRINKKVTTITNYGLKLNEQLIKFQIIDDKIVITDSLTIENIPGFNDGDVSIQDISAQKLIELIKLKPDEYILDACSAPGGKMCQILENSTSNILGLDIDGRRLSKVQQNLTRLKLSANLVIADARKIDWWNGKSFDTIIADVPCSASGTIKRNPDIKLHRKAGDINDFVKTQREIIQNLWQMVKPGGQLVYITCSIFKQENSSNIEYFTSKFKDMQVENELLLLPSPYADGFFYCILRKRNEVI